MKEPLDKYIEYFDPKHHKHYRLSYLITLKRLVIKHLLKQGYKKRDLLIVFRCNISSLRNLANSEKQMNDTDNYIQDNWMCMISAKLKPVRKINSLAVDGNQNVGFELKMM